MATPPRTNSSHDQNHIPTVTGVSTADGATPVPVEVNPLTGGMLVTTDGSIGGLVPYAYDYIAANTSDSVTDVYTYKSGGSSGTVVATITVTYADSTKASITSIART